MSSRLRSGARIEIFQSLDSTSLEAKRRAAAGEEGPLWIVALNQTSGYGRRGADWVQQEGDVAATFLFGPTAPAERLPELSFVAALAVADAVQRFAPKAPVSLKWPNDVLCGGGKLAGILLELIGVARPRIAFGVGVNIASAPTNVDYPAARLVDFAGAPPHPRDFVDELDEAFAVRRRLWEREGFGDVRREWLERSCGHGERIRVRLPQETIEGVFEDLDSTGALILDLGGERRTIAAGAVLPSTQMRRPC